MTFSHYLSGQELGGYMHPFILDTTDGVTSLFLLELIFFLHGFRESQIAAFSYYHCGVISLTGKPRNSMDEN